MVPRHIKVAEAIKQNLSEIINKHGKISFVSISHVDVSRDLSHSKVYFSFFGKSATADFESLNKYNSKLRSLLAKELKLRKVPELHFFRDNSLKEGDQILSKIKELNTSEVID